MAARPPSCPAGERETGRGVPPPRSTGRVPEEILLWQHLLFQHQEPSTELNFPKSGTLSGSVSLNLSRWLDPEEAGLGEQLLLLLSLLPLPTFGGLRERHTPAVVDPSASSSSSVLHPNIFSGQRRLQTRLHVQLKLQQRQKQAGENRILTST